MYCHTCKIAVYKVNKCINSQGEVIMERNNHQPNKWNLNLSSLVIGFLLALTLILALGADSGDNSPGRYQCCSASGDDLSVYVIDTQTGQTWRLSRTDAFDFGTPFDRKSVRRSIMPMID